MKNIIDALFFSNSPVGEIKIDPKTRFDLIVNSLKNYSKGLFAARILMCLGIYYFCGFMASAAVFFAFEIIRQAAENLVTYTLSDYENKKINIDKAENILIYHPISRAVSVGIVYLILKALGNENARDAATLVLVGNLAFMIYQNSNSYPMLVGSILPTIFVIIGSGLWEVYHHKNFGPIVSPLLFSFVMMALGLLAYRDRMRGLSIRLDMENKTETLEKLFEAQKKDTISRESVERLASVGTYNWCFAKGKKQWSPGAYAAFGFKEDEPLPSKEQFIARIAEYDRNRYLQIMHDARVKGQGFEFGFDLIDEKGFKKSVKCHGAPLLDEKGKVKGIEGIVIDQTDVHEALEKASEAQELLHMALSNGRSAVLERDFETGEMRGYGALDIFDFSKDDDPKYLEDKILRCLGRRDTHIVFGAMGRAETSGEIQYAEHSIVHADGKEIKVRVAMGVEGHLKKGKGHFVSITTDITDEVKRRDELASALEESKRASRVKSEFLANMSHEIRTPLNGVIAVAGLLARTNLDDNQREMVKLVENSGEALSHIINDVLDLARVESGRLEIEKIDFNLKEALQSVSALFSVKADEKGLNFLVDICDDANNIFIGDPIRIRQIVGNLVSNAIKFTQEGRISLCAEVKPIDEDANKFECVFTVKDTGYGMSEETLSRLFERFEQADGSITRKHGGSGLGLSISRALSKLMGGNIEVSSQIGLGSAFTFSLPLEKSSNVLSANKKPENITFDVENEVDEEEALNILAVDDNQTNRRVFDMVLSPMGINLTLCENGLEAFEAFKINNFDVILMDLQMPVMDGLTSIKKIREYEIDNQLNQIPIIAVSANAMSHHIEEAISAGANMHIAKPFTLQSLVDGIDKALSLNEDMAEEIQKNYA